MTRVNLTLDDDTFNRLERHAKGTGKARSAVARELLIDALDRLERLTRRRRLARDYALGREDDASLIAQIETAQVELADD